MLNPGDTLLNGKYQIVRLIGRGGFGFVYLALETTLNEQIAIKELVPALVGNEETLKRFLGEARATRRLTHERLVRTYDVFRDGTNYYIAMEYMAGGSLHDRLQAQGRLLPGDAVQMAIDVAEGLDYAHQWGVVHCDLKPGNILFDAQGKAKVGDFGIAHISDRLVDRTWYTSHGFVAGTVAYMSPEQAAGVRDDPRIDIYALGAVLYRALTGRSYFDLDDRVTPVAQAENINRLRSSPVLPPSTYDRRIPAWLDAVVLKALAKQADDRFATTRELYQALLRHPLQPAAQATAPAKPTPPPAVKPQPMTPPAAARSSKPARWLWILGGGALLLCVTLIVVVAIALNADDTTPPRITQVVILPGPSTSEPATPSVEPTATIAPSATPDLQLFVDEFQDTGSGWDTFEVDSASAGYQAGEYRISVSQTNWMAWANPPAMELDNYEIQVDTRAVEGPLNNSFGLVVRYQPDTRDFYWFRASSDGWVSVVLYYNTKSSVIVEWQQSAAVVQGLGMTNRLQIVVAGNTYRFVINGVQVLELVDDTLQGGGIGLAVGSLDEPGVAVHFDHLSVHDLTP